MQIELPSQAWTPAMTAHDDAHTWTLPALAPLLFFAPLAEYRPHGDTVRVSIAGEGSPELTVTY